MYSQANSSTEVSMKKTITITLISLSALIILDSLNAGQALMMFFLAGVIPGTNIAIDAGRALELFALITGFVLARIALNSAPQLFIKRNNALRPKL